LHNGSDHLTAFNIYNNLYLKNETKYLNKKMFNNIDKRIKELDKNAKSINETRYAYMNEKYNLVNKKPYTNQMDNIIYIIGLSHYYNLIKKEGKNYVSINYLRNSNATIKYMTIMPESVKKNSFAICNTLIDAFGKKSFQCITQLPNNILLDIIKNENLYIDNSKIIKKELK
jgi:hypothetical protein